jgi:hypothetical protein
MGLIKYSEFDRLRLREFAAADPAYDEDEEEHGTGLLEQIRGLIFARVRSHPEQLHTVDLEFRYAPPAVAQAVLHRLGLAFSGFDSQEAVERHWGVAVRHEIWPPDYRVAWYEIGDSDRYLLRCGFGNDNRLDVIVLARLDFEMDGE